MIANPKTTEYVIIGHPSRINKITGITKFKVAWTEVKRAHNLKSLGLVIDEKLNGAELNWNSHFKLSKEKIGAGLSSLKQL